MTEKYGLIAQIPYDSTWYRIGKVNSKLYAMSKVMAQEQGNKLLNSKYITHFRVVTTKESKNYPLLLEKYYGGGSPHGNSAAINFVL